VKLVFKAMCTGKVKVAPVLNYVLGSGGRAPRIIDLGTRWR